jgi:hypothetical protein
VQVVWLQQRAFRIALLCNNTYVCHCPGACHSQAYCCFLLLLLLLLLLFPALPSLLQRAERRATLQLDGAAHCALQVWWARAAAASPQAGQCCHHHSRHAVSSVTIVTYYYIMLL